MMVRTARWDRVLHLPPSRMSRPEPGGLSVRVVALMGGPIAPDQSVCMVEYRVHTSVCLDHMA